MSILIVRPEDQPCYSCGEHHSHVGACGLKRCSRCRQYWPPEMFNKCRSVPGGLQSLCRDCNAAYQRDYKKGPMRAQYYATMRVALKRRAARLKDHDATLSRAEEAAIKAYGGCIYCGAECDPEVDHFIADCNGGPTSVGNMVPACRACNRGLRHGKWSKSPWQWIRERFGADAPVVKARVEAFLAMSSKELLERYGRPSISSKRVYDELVTGLRAA